MRRIGLVAVSVLIAITSAPASPVASGHPADPVGHASEPPPAASLAVTSVRTVRLITGDAVRVLTRADGSSAARIVAGPHSRGPVARWRTADGASYLMPATAAGVSAKLDSSLFDVSRLAQLSGSRVPVVITMRPDAATAARRTVARRLAADATSSSTVRGSYGAGFGGLRDRDLAAIRSIRLAGPAPSEPSPPGPQHALTVNVHHGNGHPASAVVFIENVDDADRYLETPHVDGNITADVPEGNYAVMAWTSSRLVVVPEIAVTQDSTVDLDLSEATVRPHVSMPGHRVREAVLSVGRSPDAGFSFPVQFSGPRFFMRVRPADGDVAHGALHTGISAKLAPTGRASDHELAVTADVADGIPADLTFTHHRADFARVVDRFHANGPAGQRQTYVDAAAADVDFWTGSEYDVSVPGRRALLLQAAPGTVYQQTLFPQAEPGSNDLTQLIVVARYPVAGRTYGVTFAHGPVGPGWEGNGPSRGVSRDGDHLRGSMPLFSGAGSKTFSYVDRADGSWELRRDGHRIAGGRHEVSFDVAVPRGRRTYELDAVSQPAAANWQLSTRVEDLWRFHSARGAATPAILVPSYVPPISLSGRLRPGPTHFELSFRTPPRAPRIARAGVELSTDGGRTWRPARVVRTGPAAFDVRYLNPAAGAEGTMSLRVSGRDRHGNTVRETAIDVYRLG